MADNKNMELNDEMMAKAIGGTGEGTHQPQFNVGDKVWYNHDKWRDVFGIGIVTEVRDIDYFYTYAVQWEKYNPGDSWYREDQIVNA